MQRYQDIAKLVRSIIIHSPQSSECTSQCFVRCIDTKRFVVSGDPVCLLVVRPEREADVHPAGRHAGEAAQTQPQAVPPRALLEVCRVGIPETKDDVKTLDKTKEDFLFVYLLFPRGTMASQ